MSDISPKEANDIFRFCAETGQLHWKELWGRRRNPAGTVHPLGYIVFTIRGKQYRAHRVIWAMHRGDASGLVIDHINGNKSDNRIENLRACTAAENSRNRRGAPKHSKLGVLGIRRQSGRNGYVARISFNGRDIYLGTFPTIGEAKAAHRAASQQYHREFSAYGNAIPIASVESSPDAIARAAETSPPAPAAARASFHRSAV